MPYTRCQHFATLLRLLKIRALATRLGHFVGIAPWLSLAGGVRRGATAFGECCTSHTAGYVLL
jgi:hypothetical protein